jgi:hypothetical protein
MAKRAKQKLRRESVDGELATVEEVALRVSRPEEVHPPNTPAQKGGPLGAVSGLVPVDLQHHAVCSCVDAEPAVGAA